MEAFAMVPAEVSSSGSVMSSGIDAATMGIQLEGVATVTSPAPERSAACPAIAAAPLFPRDPRNDQDLAVVTLVGVFTPPVQHFGKQVRRDEIQIVLRGKNQAREDSRCPRQSRPRQTYGPEETPGSALTR